MAFGFQAGDVDGFPGCRRHDLRSGRGGDGRRRLRRDRHDERRRLGRGDHHRLGRRNRRRDLRHLGGRRTRCRDWGGYVSFRRGLRLGRGPGPGRDRPCPPGGRRHHGHRRRKVRCGNGRRCQRRTGRGWRHHRRARRSGCGDWLGHEPDVQVGCFDPPLTPEGTEAGQPQFLLAEGQAQQQQVERQGEQECERQPPGFGVHVLRPPRIAGTTSARGSRPSAWLFRCPGQPIS